LHGDMDQRSRMAMLQGFKDNKIQLLVASDVAARGLDIPDVSHVFNFDVPISAEDYVHRIGRTGRAGRSGAAFMLVTPGDRKAFEAIEALISEKVEWLSEPPEWDDRARRGGRGRAAPAAKGASARSGKREEATPPAKGGRREHRARGDSPKREESVATPEAADTGEAPAKAEKAPRREKRARSGEGRTGQSRAGREQRTEETASDAPREARKPQADKGQRAERQPDRTRDSQRSEQPDGQRGDQPDGQRDNPRDNRERPRKSTDRNEGASVEVHDNDHPFGGEENIPAFLRG
jgi:superfamily II DNA/RNA helicase